MDDGLKSLKVIRTALIGRELIAVRRCRDWEAEEFRERRLKIETQIAAMSE